MNQIRQFINLAERAKQSILNEREDCPISMCLAEVYKAKLADWLRLNALELAAELEAIIEYEDVSDDWLATAIGDGE